MLYDTTIQEFQITKIKEKKKIRESLGKNKRHFLMFVSISYAAERLHVSSSPLSLEWKRAGQDYTAWDGQF